MSDLVPLGVHAAKHIVQRYLPENEKKTKIKQKNKAVHSRVSQS